MKIVIDENIAFAEEAFSRFGDIELYNGREITNEILKDADALITRSITNVNEQLLSNTNVKFVGTATIGTDHIDLDYLQSRSITFASAAGCNSWAVTEYVFSAISHLCSEHNISLTGKSIGIVGVGNIGSRIARVGEAIGLKVVKNDPPLKRETGSDEYKELNDTLDCDIVTFHVPLNKEGLDKTVHLLNEQNIENIKPGTILINTSRGPVVENSALKRRLLDNKDIYTVLDVWENEPNIDYELLNHVNIGTAHIAGYSLEGKVNGTKMVYDALCEFLGVEKSWNPSLPPVANNKIYADKNNTVEKFLEGIFKSSYIVKTDDELLRDRNNRFDRLRKNYKLRRELVNYEVDSKKINEAFIRACSAFRIKII